MDLWQLKILVTKLVEAPSASADSLKTLYEEASTDIVLMKRLKRIILMKELEHRSFEDLQKAKNFASVLINCVFFPGFAVRYLWRIIFDWTVPMAVKRNLENSLVRLLVYLNLRLENIFEHAIKRSIEWLVKKTRNLYLQNIETVEIGNSWVRGELIIYFRVDQKPYCIQDVIIFLSTCIVTAIRKSTKDSKDVKDLKCIFETLQPYVQLIMQTHRPLQDMGRLHRSYTQLLRLLNYILGICKFMSISSYQAKQLRKTWLLSLNLSSLFFIRIYQIATNSHNNQSCFNYCCHRNQSDECNQIVLQLKVEAAKLHFHFLNNHIHKGFQLKQNFINNILLTANCVQGPHHTASQKLSFQFTVCLLKIYQVYCQQHFVILRLQHQRIVKTLIEETLRIGANEQSLYEDSFQKFNHLFENCAKQRDKSHPKVVAAKILHFFASKSSTILNYLTDLCQNGLKFNPNPNPSHSPSFSPQTCLFLLTIIFDLLPTDNPLPHQLLQLSNSNKLRDLSNLSLTLLLLISHHNFTRIFIDPAQSEYLILQGIKNRSSGLVRLLALQLAEMNCTFNWDIFQSIYDELDKQSEIEFIERMSNPAKWSYLIKYIKQHLRKFDRERLEMMLKGLKDRIKEEFSRIRSGCKMDETALMKNVQVVDLIVSDRYFVMMADCRLKNTLRDFHLLRNEAGQKQTEIKANLLAIIGKLLVVEYQIPPYLLEILPPLIEQFSRHPAPSLLILFSQYLIAYEFGPNEPPQIVELYTQVMNRLESSAQREHFSENYLKFIEDMLVFVQSYIYAVRYGVSQSQLERVVKVCNCLLEKKVLRARVVSTYALTSMYINDSFSIQDIQQESEYGTFRGAEAELFLSYFPRIMDEINKNAFDKFRMLLTAAYAIVKQNERFTSRDQSPENITKFSYPWKLNGSIDQKGLICFNKIRNNSELYDIMVDLQMIPDEIEGYFLNIEESNQQSKIQTSKNHSPPTSQQPSQELLSLKEPSSEEPHEPETTFHP